MMNAIVEAEVAEFGMAAVVTEEVITTSKVLAFKTSLPKTSASAVAPRLLMIRNSIAVNGPNNTLLQGGLISAA